MLYIKDFRKALGLSQLQLALSASSISTKFSIKEIQRSFPPDLTGLFLGHKQKIVLAHSAILIQTFISPPLKISEILKDLDHRIDKKISQLLVHRRQLVLMVKRQLMLSSQVYAGRGRLKAGSDSVLSAKMDALKKKSKFIEKKLIYFQRKLLTI